MAKKLVVEIVGDSKSLDRAFSKASKSSDSLGRSFLGLGKAAAVAGVALATAAAVGIGKSITAASNLEEQLNKTATVFGKNSGEVHKWSANLAASFGLSQRAALEAAGTFGNMLVPMGFSRTEAAGMSQQFVELAADMASFNNASPEATLDALRAGLAGETEPLRRFGVFLNDARIKAQALEMGLYSGKGALDAQAKAAATAAIIMKDTADTQGDFGRTSESMANQLRIVKAQLENVAASFGSVFLPIVREALGFVTGKVIPGLSRAADTIKDFWKNMTQELGKAPNLRAKIQIVIENVKELAGKFLDGFIAAIQGLLPQKPVLISPHYEATGGGTDWEKIAEDVVTALAVALQASVTLGQALGKTINDAIDSVNWNDIGKKLGPGLASALVVAFTTLLDPGFWIENWELALAVALVVFKAKIVAFAGKALAPVGAALTGIITKVSPMFAAAMGRLIDDAGRVALAVWGRVSGTLERLVAAGFKKIGALATFTVKVLGLNVAIAAIADFVRAALAKFKELLDWLTRLPTKIQTAVGDLSGTLWSAGVAIIQGLWDGAKSKVGDFLSWLGGLKKLIPLHKGPPAEDAKLLYDVGQLIMKGLGDGMNVGWEKVSAMLDGLSPKVEEKASALVESMRQAIENKSSVFASAFDSLVSNALSAFDRISSEFQTKTERLIKRQDEARAKADRQRAKSEAERAVAEAEAALAAVPTIDVGGRQVADPQAAQAALDALKSAQQQLADAKFAIQRAQDEREAAQERRQYEQKRERQRLNLETQLGALKTAYLNQEITTQQFHTRLIGIFKKFEVPLGKAGNKVGLALAKGLTDSFAAVSNAAKALAAEVLRVFDQVRVIVNVDLSTGGGNDKRQHGGPVRAGKSYIVGEVGPELFVPSSSGTIKTADATARMATGGGVQINIYGDVTGDEVVNKVRRGLLDLGLYNPGVLGGRA